METKDQADKRYLKELEGKNVQYYSVLLTAWINTKMEHDKTLITLSAAAIGLLITILTTKTVIQTWLVWIYIFAFVGYLITIYAALIIYQRNSLHIEKELKGQSGKDPHLERLDKLCLYSFSLATLAFILIGVFTATLKIKEEKTKMAEDKNQHEIAGNRSLNGISNVRPENNQSPGSANSNQSNNNNNSEKK